MDTISKRIEAILLVQAVKLLYASLWFYFTHHFLRRRTFSVKSLTAHFFAIGQVQLLKIPAAQVLGNGFTREPNSIEV